MPPAPVAPGPKVVNTLAPAGIVLRLEADYGRTSAVPQNALYSARLVRPGAILLANLNVSDATRLAGATGDLVTLIDARDDEVNGQPDVPDMTDIESRIPAKVNSRASKVVMRIDPKDAKRVRIFDINNPDPKLPKMNIPVVLGDGKAEALVADLTTTLSPSFFAEATTLPGDAHNPAPTGPSPNKSTLLPATLPTGSSGAPVYSKRAPGDVWVELVHQDSGGKDLKAPREVALFTIAPFLLLTGALPAIRIFVVNYPDGNHNFVFDLTEACNAAFGAAVPMPATTSAPFASSKPADKGPLYLIDGSKTLDPADGKQDPWIQDEIEIGYCFAPHQSMHVVLHCKRNRGLDAFVHQEIAATGLAVYDALHDSGFSTDYGGNVEATPPILKATPALGAGAGGPATPAHKPAPFGKIVLGDCAERKVHADYREFLIAQRVQPILPIDTSWLSVGHVDEVVSFVTTASPKGFKMLFASVGTMTALLEEARKVPIASGRTGFHRGKWRSSPTRYDEISVETLLGKVKKFNDFIRAQKLVPMDQRLKTGLSLDESDIIRVPSYFEIPATQSAHFTSDASRTAAHTIGMVNMVVIGKHLVIPKPFGTRMAPADATSVLKKAFAKLGIKDAVKLAGTGDTFWVEPGERPENIACYFTESPSDAERKNVIEHLNDSSKPLSPVNLALMAKKALEIGSHPNNAAVAASFVPAITTGAFADWVRIFVPSNTVDLIESYMLSVLEPHGFTLHFVDDWYYHDGVGEAHCGTNAVREMPEKSNSRRWWDEYDPDRENRYSP